MSIKKKLKSKTIVASLVVAIVFLIFVPTFIIINNLLQPYSKVLIALDRAEISKHELNTCIDVILEEEIDDLDFENIDDASLEIFFEISGKIANIIEPKAIASFVYYYINPPRSNKPLFVLARNYYTNKFKELGNKFHSSSGSTAQNFIECIYEVLLTEESRKNITENEFRYDLPFMTEFYFLLAKFLDGERINHIYAEMVSDGIESVAVRDLCYFGIELGKSMSSLNNEAFQTVAKYLLETAKYNEDLLNVNDDLIKMLDYPLAILAVLNYLSIETEVGIVGKCLDYPHVDIVFENFLRATKETDYYQENKNIVDEQLDEFFENLYNVFVEYF